jgi:hypothetical protein
MGRAKQSDQSLALTPVRLEPVSNRTVRRGMSPTSFRIESERMTDAPSLIRPERASRRTQHAQTGQRQAETIPHTHQERSLNSRNVR